MEAIKEMWSNVLTYLKQSNDISQVGYDNWISKMELCDVEKDAVVVSVPDEFHRKILQEHYAERIKEAFSAVFGLPLDLKILCVPKAASAERAPAAVPTMEEEEYTFGNFVVGPSNKFPHAASLAVASNPSGAYNPLFIYGNSGLGKTHLLFAIRNEIRQTHPHFKMLYTKGETMTNELIEALQKGPAQIQEFRAKYRQVDVLLVDDIQFISGKTSTQEEFFHTFDTLYQAKKQIVLTSDRPPKEMAALEERLRSRFESGLLADIQPPDLETRIAIIKRKAEQIRLPIDEKDVVYIAEQLKSNIRQLEGLVKKLWAYYQIEGSMPSRPTIQSAIYDVRNDDQPVPITVERIINEVGRTFNVAPEDIRSSKRSGDVSNARQIAQYIVRAMTNQPMKKIGEDFGSRDHSTVVYAIQRVEERIARDPSYKARIQDIIKNLSEK